jgi:hypothetical protein
VTLDHDFQRLGYTSVHESGFPVKSGKYILYIHSDVEMLIVADLITEDGTPRQWFVAYPKGGTIDETQIIMWKNVRA